MKRIVPILVSATLALVLLFLLVTPEGEAATITVDPAGGAEFETIQEALDNASEGDRVEVLPGNYSEHLVVNTRVTLQGQGAEETRLFAGGLGVVLTINANGTTVTGFRLSGASQAGILVQANNVTLRNCLSIFNSYGVQASGVSGLLVSNSNCTLNSRDGISLENSEDCVLVDNILYLNDVAGISLHQCQNISARDNFLRKNYYYGIHLWDSTGCSLSANTMEECSIYVRPGPQEYMDSHSIPANNTVNREPVRYLVNVSGLEITGNTGQLIMVNVTGARIRDIFLWNLSTGVQLAYSEDVFLGNVSCIYGWYGLEISWSRNVTLDGGFYKHNRRAGIFAIYSSQLTIRNTVCPGNGAAFYTSTKHGQGIYLRDTNSSALVNNSIFHTMGPAIYLVNSSGNLISSNSCLSSIGEGIYLDRGSQWNTVTGNNCSDNWEAAIRVSSGSHRAGLLDNICQGMRYGVQLEDSDGVTLTGNLITANHVGIIIEDSRNASARGNTIANNRDFGVKGAEDPTFSFDARKNYWGSDTGPLNLEINSKGKGNSVTGELRFTPWYDGAGNEQQPVPETEHGEFSQLAFLLLLLIFCSPALAAVYFMCTRPWEEGGEEDSVDHEGDKEREPETR